MKILNLDGSEVGEVSKYSLSGRRQIPLGFGSSQHEERVYYLVETDAVLSYGLGRGKYKISCDDFDAIIEVQEELNGGYKVEERSRENKKKL